MQFARVAVTIPTLSGMFDYHIPPELTGQIERGCLVSVPFGQQTVQGVVMALVDTPAVAETRPLGALLDPQPVLTAAQQALALELSETTLTPLAALVEAMLPPGLSQHADTLYSLAHPERLDAGSAPSAGRLVELLAARGPLRARQIDRHFPARVWRPLAERLVRRGVLARRSVLPPPGVRAKFIRTAQLAIDPAAAQQRVEEAGRESAARTRRSKAVQFLISEPEAVAVNWVYAASGCTLADLQALEEQGLIILRETEIFRDPLKRLGAAGNAAPVVDLSAPQQAAMAQILPAFEAGAAGCEPFLLHGVTASGKTEVYLQAAQEAVRRGRQVLVLVPEIALTPQTVRRFMARFPGQVGLLHSSLSDGERYDTWRRARAGLLQVIIGPRSALFAPLANIGLIVVDECHDTSYYQSEPPFYHAVSAAQAYARLCGAVCILGSATPPVALRQRAGDGLHLLELPERVVGETSGPPVQVVDMRAELKAGQRGIFSRALVEALSKMLARAEQGILYLNRRGTATHVFCRECGWVMRCPHCDAPLTFHLRAANSSRQEGLICHRCGYARKKPDRCPQCASAHIREYGLGSEKVEQEVQALFPRARTLRWDWDTTRTKDAHELILTHFSNHQADVLVGTQMLAKGLDLPRVTLVGIVLADVGLSLPDPFADERSFQLLTQVSGRAGRSSLGGQVILQTYQPEHPVIRFAAGGDYAAFYAHELENRRSLRYPPFARLVRLEYRHRDALAAEQAAEQLASRLKDLKASARLVETDVIGPAPCFFSRVDGDYRWQIVLRGPRPQVILAGLPLDGWRVEVEPVNLL